MFEELKLMFEEFQGGFGVVNKDMLLLSRTIKFC